jgi:hypothetical protein
MDRAGPIIPDYQQMNEMLCPNAIAFHFRWQQAEFSGIIDRDYHESLHLP